MPADLKNAFGESCCDGGACSGPMSAQNCGCDPGMNYHCSDYPFCSWGKFESSIPDTFAVESVVGMQAMEDAMRDTVPAVGFTVKDSGKRETYAGGMVRDITEGKLNYALVADGPMLKRWAEHLTKGAMKYGEGNWLKAEGNLELNRARQSAFRHFVQWFYGEVDEDHASAVLFNINECEYIKLKMAK